MSKHIWAVVAHADDEVIGCGGALYKHFLQGDKITLITMTNGVGSRSTSNCPPTTPERTAAQIASILGADLIQHSFPDNEMDSISMLTVVKALEASLDGNNTPDTIYTHHAGDLNIDHRIVHEATLTAFRPQPGNPKPTILAFEVNSSTEWQSVASHQAFRPNYFVDISETINNKTQLLKCYSDELHPAPHSRSIEGIQALARFRGTHYRSGIC